MCVASTSPAPHNNNHRVGDECSIVIAVDRWWVDGRDCDGVEEAVLGTEDECAPDAEEAGGGDEGDGEKGGGKEIREYEACIMGSYTHTSSKLRKPKR